MVWAGQFFAPDPQPSSAVCATSLRLNGQHHHGPRLLPSKWKTSMRDAHVDALSSRDLLCSTCPYHREVPMSSWPGAGHT
jgi:hypothetical protein